MSEWEKVSGHNALRTRLVALSFRQSDILQHQYTHLCPLKTTYEGYLSLKKRKLSLDKTSSI